MYFVHLRHILLYISCSFLEKGVWISLKIFKALQHETIFSNKKHFFISFHYNKQNYIFKSKFAVNSLASIALEHLK